MSEPAPRQALQQRVAAAILDGAARMFAVEGEQASMNDVAAAAGVARATVYRYFPNRQALLEELAQAAVATPMHGWHRPGSTRWRRRRASSRAVRALVDVGDSFVLLARERVRSDPGALRAQASTSRCAGYSSVVRPPGTSATTSRALA